MSNKKTNSSSEINLFDSEDLLGQKVKSKTKSSNSSATSSTSKDKKDEYDDFRDDLL